MRVATGPRAFKTYWLATRISAPLSTRLAGFFAERIWFTPWRVDPGERGRRRQREWLQDTQPARFSTSHGPLVGFSAGRGPAILLVHGWGERAASMGAFVEPLTGAGFRVVAIDLPGHGDSVSMRPNIYTIADAIREVADAVGGLHGIVAHSLGGHSTMAALRDGLDVPAVVLISPSSRAEHAVDRFTELLRLPGRAKAGLEAALERRFGRSIWDDLTGSNLIREVTTPALIVHDRGDPQVAFDDSWHLSRAWRGARLMITESLGHGRILRDPRVLANSVSFLRGDPSSDTIRPKELEHAGG
ncbi:MAG: alpha/beta fold hydrolase [Actinomycetota bacterium]